VALRSAGALPQAVRFQLDPDREHGQGRLLDLEPGSGGEFFAKIALRQQVVHAHAARLKR